MRRFCDVVEKALKYVAVVVVLLMLLALAAQVFLRYVFGISLSWSEELALLGFGWVIVIATAVGVRRMTHARMDLLLNVLPASLRWVIERLIAVMLFGLGLFLAYYGWDYMVETRGATSAAIGFPIEFLYALAPAFGALLALFSFERLLPHAESLNE
ncbi:MAG: TRAP transporter small permease [Betaproteobacteria bacterium]